MWLIWWCGCVCYYVLVGVCIGPNNICGQTTKLTTQMYFN
jgi:hypothetical protein